MPVFLSCQFSACFFIVHSRPTFPVQSLSSCPVSVFMSSCPVFLFILCLQVSLSCLFLPVIALCLPVLLPCLVYLFPPNVCLPVLLPCFPVYLRFVFKSPRPVFLIYSVFLFFCPVQSLSSFPVQFLSSCSSNPFSCVCDMYAPPSIHLVLSSLSPPDSLLCHSSPCLMSSCPVQSLSVMHTSCSVHYLSSCFFQTLSLSST